MEVMEMRKHMIIDGAATNEILFLGDRIVQIQNDDNSFIADFLAAVRGDENTKINYTTDDIVMMSIYSFQAITLLTCVCFRYFWYREVGLYSL